MLTGRAVFMPDTVDEEKRTVELVWTSGARVLRGYWDQFWEELSLDPKHVRMGRLNNGAPLLDSHSMYRVSDVLGVVESARLEKNRGVAVVRFAKAEDDPEADKVFRKVKDGILQNISVGYRVHKFEQTDGADGDIPIRLAVDWEPHELSIVPVGADDEAGFRSAQKLETPCELISAARSRALPQDAAKPEEQMAEQAEKTAAAPAAAPTDNSADRIASLEKSVERMASIMERIAPQTNFGAQVADASRSIDGAPAIAQFGKRRQRAPIEPGKDEGRGIARVAMSVALSRMTPGMGYEDAAKELGFGETADAMDRERGYRRALGESSIASGGAFVPEEFADTFISELGAKAVVRSLIPQSSVLRVTRGDSLSIPELTSRPTSAFLGEAQSPTNSTPGTGLKNIPLHYMSTEVVIGKDWLLDVANADMMVRDIMVRSAAAREDLALVEGSGSEYEPKGIKLFAGNSQAAQSSPTYQKTIDDLDALIYFLEQNNVDIDPSMCGYIGAPRHYKGLRGFQDAQGNRRWREEMRGNNTLNGHRFVSSSQLSTTGAASAFYFGNFSHAIIAEKMAMEIEEDSTYTSGGVAKSASSARQTVLRLWRRFGFGVTHPEAFAYLSTVTWGA